MNSVRIIGGEWKRRVIHFPSSEGLRPTPDRVRETLFNWLGQDMHGRVCLDLFSGSGALGFEAASRGAKRVVLVDKSPKVRAALLENAKTLGVTCGSGERMEILAQDAVKFASTFNLESPCFDVVFLDPPYKHGWIEQIEPLLPRLLRPDGALYVEAEKPLERCGAWETVRSGRAGQVYYHLMRSGDHNGA